MVPPIRQINRLGASSEKGDMNKLELIIGDPAGVAGAPLCRVIRRSDQQASRAVRRSHRRRPASAILDGLVTRHLQALAAKPARYPRNMRYPPPQHGADRGMPRLVGRGATEPWYSLPRYPMPTPSVPR
jgi:hypothetical protein